MSRLRFLIRGQAHELVIAVFALVTFAVYAASPVIQSGDSRLVVYESDSLIRQGNIDLSEQGRIVHGWPCYRERGRVISRYPWGTAVVALPLVAVFRAGGEVLGADPTEDLREAHPRQLEKLLASAIAALAAVAFLLLGRESVGRMGPALALGATFALGSSLWSTASRGLWQHGPLALFTCLGLFCLVRGRRREDWRWSALAGVPLGLAFVVRPNVAVTIALVGLVLLFTDRRALLGFAAATGAVVVPTVAVNLSLYGTVITPVYLPGRGPVQTGISSTLLEGLAGTLVSPGRGLLVYCPFLVVAGVGLWLRRRELNGIDVVAIGSILFLWYSVANSTTWEAGASFGSRYLSDSLPFWAWLIAPVYGLVIRPARTSSPAVATLAALLLFTVAWSVVVHGRGATSWATQLWNSKPKLAYLTTDRSRLWSWHDPQFFRGGKARYEDLYPQSGLPAVPLDQLCIYKG